MIRLIEFFASLMLLIVLLPLLLIITLTGFFDTGSPFFKQKRVGLNQKPFYLLKFRTMKKSTGDLPTHLVDGQLITKTGKILRRTKLDELPQLWNVLIGHMSLVGPRPCLPSQIELLQERRTRDVFTVRPGITGIAQINEVDMSQPLRLARYDALYVKRFSVKLYVYCLWMTFIGKGSGDRVINS